ncbi:MAG: sensor histidine kinase [Bacteriovoracia bacterium]
MIRRRDRRNYSITDLVWSFAKKIRTYDGLLILSLFVVATAFVLHSSHSVMCSLVETKLDALSGPLARELSLGDSQTSNAIFSDLKDTLRRLGASENLVLTTENAPRSFAGKSCSPSFFSSSISFPISFGEESLGRIAGTVGYFSVYRILLIIFLALVSLAVAFRVLTKKLTSALQQSMIDPLLALSKDVPLEDSNHLPSEVYEIQDNIQKLKTEIQEKERVNFSLMKAHELGRLAAQVAHDIRSPLTTLLSVVGNSQKLLPPEERNQLRASASRIQKIADDLITKYREPGETRPGFTLAASLIDSILLEKNVILRNSPDIQLRQNISDEAVCLGVAGSDSDLLRVLSNLINNSIEATKGKDRGVIWIRLAREGEFLKFIVKDNGKGMTDEVLKRIRTQGGTYGKVSGSGIGLQHAKNFITSSGGQLSIDSKVDEGTTVAFTLPIAPTPTWFAKELEISPEETVVVLDDDESVHLVWHQRLGERRAVYLKSPKEFDIEKFPPRSCRYIFDLEILGCSVSGLDLIRSLSLGRKATLVTSYHDDPKVQSEIEKAGAKLLPKFMIPMVPIVDAARIVHSRVENPDLVLIDDDPLVHELWRSTAKRKALRLLALEKEQDLHTFQVALDTPIYVDKNLGNEVSGIDVARRIYEAGFKKIYLTTGEDISESKGLELFAGIAGKEFPELL